MGRVCSVCAFPGVEEVNRALVAGEAQRAVARRFGLSRHAVHRHANNHLPAVMLQGQAEREHSAAEDLAAHLEDLRNQAQEIKGLALKAGDLRCGLQAIRELARLLELRLRWLGLLRDGEAQPVTIYLPEVDAEAPVVERVSVEAVRPDVAELEKRLKQAERDLDWQRERAQRLESELRRERVMYVSG